MRRSRLLGIEGRHGWKSRGKKKRGEGGGEGVSCAESIIFISPGSTGLLLSRILFLVPLSPSKEPSRAKCSPPPPSLPSLCRENIPPRIDRFEMRELCAAVIPWCDDLSIASNRADLYALVILSRTVAYLAVLEDVLRLTMIPTMIRRCASLVCDSNMQLRLYENLLARACYNIVIKLSLCCYYNFHNFFFSFCSYNYYVLN